MPGVPPPPHEPTHDADAHAGGHVPETIEEAAGTIEASARDAERRASSAAHTVTSSAVQARKQAGGQLVELGQAARRDDPRHWRALAACIVAIVATAIDPPILQATSSGVQGALAVEPEAAAALVGLYYLVQAGTMVAGGVLGDRFGIRRVMLLGLAGMLATSLIAAFATTLPVLLVGSVGMALCSAVVVPLSLAAVMGTFGKRVLPVAIALYLALQLVASLLAPPTARALFDAGGWAATYAPAILATFIGLVIGRRWLATSVPGDRMSRVDAISLTLWSVGMLGLVYAIVAFAGGWGEMPGLAAAVGVLCLLWAASRLARGTTHLHLPHVPFRIVGVTLFTGGVLGLVQSGSLMQLSSFLKGVQGSGDLESGLALAPFVVATLIASMVTGVLLTRWYRAAAVDLGVFRRPIVLGLALAAGGVLTLSTLAIDSSYLPIGVALVLLGGGAAIANVPRTDLLFRSVRADRVGVSAGLNGSCALLGEALGNVAVTTMIALSGAAAWQSQMVDAGMTQEQAASAFETAQRAIFLASAHPYLEPSFLDVVQDIPGWDEIFTAGFTDAMLVLGVIALGAALIAFVGLRGRPAGTVSPSGPRS
jgi:DHA2 family multidrug resistance protein-like MFS transporter